MMVNSHLKMTDYKLVQLEKGKSIYGPFKILIDFNSHHLTYFHLQCMEHFL